MAQGYFQRVAAETETRLWINNPTHEEVSEALAAGAICCTTNPSHCARLLDAAPTYIRSLVDGVIPETPNDDAAAERIYYLAVRDLIALFRPVYESSGGTLGFVTLQGDPRRDDDPTFIVGEALRSANLGPNYMAKIPVTEAGAAAIEALVARNIPICATEIFAVDQAIYICEAYERAARETGNRPAFFVTHITGIFDEYLAGYARSHGVSLAPEMLASAGWAVAHEQYRLMKARGYPGIMLGGGARGLHHFTDMVGGDMHITINWSTAAALLSADGPVVSKIHELAPEEVTDVLSEKLPDFRKAFHEGGLSPAEFKDYGPLLHFRNAFLKGYNRLVAEVAARRQGAPLD
jgi:transaldolase